MVKQGGLTDSWIRLHPEPRNPIPSGLTPEEGVSIMGVTCDTPLNSWSKHTWLNYLTNDPIGERLDYIFYRETPEMVCTSVDVVVRDQVSGIGAPNSGAKNLSDHFGVNAKFTLKPAEYHFQNRTSVATAQADSSTSSIQETTKQQEGLSIDLLEQILLVLNQHKATAEKRFNLELKVIFPLMLIGALGLIIAFFWIEPRWAAFIVALVVSALSAGWIVHFLYGFLYGGETLSSYTNTIQEVQTVLDYKLLSEKKTTVSIAGASRTTASSRQGRGGLLQK